LIQAGFELCEGNGLHSRCGRTLGGVFSHG
jgi:hypothetical protein